MGGLLLHRLEVHVEEVDVRLGQADDLQIVDVIDVPGVLEDGRHIRGDEGARLAAAHDQRTVLTDRKDRIRNVHEEDTQRISAADAVHHLNDGLQRILLTVLLIIILQQYRHDLRVGLGLELVALFQ